MSREIKFRAWNKSNKQFDNFDELLEPYNHDDVSLLCKILDKSLNTDEYTLMQFTGLLDLKGVEIYEGDIVKWDDCSNGKYWRVAVVEINPDIQFKIVKNCIYELSAEEGKVFQFGSFIYTDTHNHLEVIGNIYENPELLN